MFEYGNINNLILEECEIIDNNFDELSINFEDENFDLADFVATRIKSKNEKYDFDYIKTEVQYSYDEHYLNLKKRVESFIGDKVEEKLNESKPFTEELSERFLKEIDALSLEDYYCGDIDYNFINKLSLSFDSKPSEELLVKICYLLNNNDKYSFLLEKFEEKNKELLKQFYDTNTKKCSFDDKKMLQILDKGYDIDSLLSDLSNEDIDIVLNISVDELKTIIDNNNYKILQYVDAKLFLELGEEEIKKIMTSDNNVYIPSSLFKSLPAFPKEDLINIINNTNLLSYRNYDSLDEDAKNVIEYFHKNMDVVTLVSLLTSKALFYVRDSIDYSESEINDLISNNYGYIFDNNKKIISNPIYQKIFFDKGLYNFITNLNSNEISLELKEMIKSNVKLLIEKNIIPPLKDNEMFNLFYENCKESADYSNLLNSMSKNDELTDDKKIKCLLNDKNRSVIISDEDIETAVKNGYVFSEKTVIKTKEELIKFISLYSNNLVDFYNIVQQSKMIDFNVLSNRDVQRIIINSCVDIDDKDYNQFIINEGLYYPNKDEEIKNGEIEPLIVYLKSLIQEYNINIKINPLHQYHEPIPYDTIEKFIKNYPDKSKKLFDYIVCSDKLFYNFFDRHEDIFDTWLNIYNPDNVVKKYIQFKNDYQNNIPFIHNISDIKNYFDENGPKNNFYSTALRYKETVYVCNYDKSWYKYFNYKKPAFSDNEKTFLDFVEKFGTDIYDLINTNDEDIINKLFNEMGPNKLLLEKSLFNKRLYKNVYQSGYYDWQESKLLNDNIKTYIQLLDVNGFDGLDEFDNVDKVNSKLDEPNGLRNIASNLFEKNNFKSLSMLSKEDIKYIFENVNFDKANFYNYLSQNIDIEKKYNFMNDDYFIKEYSLLLKENIKLSVKPPSYEVEVAGTTTIVIPDPQICSFFVATSRIFELISEEKINSNDILRTVKNNFELLNKNDYKKIGILNISDPTKSNYNISSDFLLYGYPFIKKHEDIFGNNYANIFAFDSDACYEFASAVKNSNEELLLKYYNFMKQSNIFEEERLFHLSFRYLSNILPLIKNIFDNNIQLDSNDINNLSNIIMNNNPLDITTVDGLHNYYSILKTKLEENIEGDYRTSILFGYRTFNMLKNDFEEYQIDNFPKINYMLSSIEDEKVREDLKLTEREMKIILLIKSFIREKGQTNLMFEDKNFVPNYGIELQKVISKIKKIYNYHIDNKLTKDLDKNNDAKKYKKTIRMYSGDDIFSTDPDEESYNKEVEYEIIDYDEREFKFLSHTLYNFDHAFEDFSLAIRKRPQLWFKLDGASTLSTSSISDKGFWMLDTDGKGSFNEGVIYLFNEVTPSFLLYMYGRDLGVEHGGHKLEPMSKYNYFTDLDSLNQSSFYESCRWNEIAGFREGMKPCAIACLSEEPTEEQIRAAVSFNIPIIRFDVKKYEDKRQKDFETAKANFLEKPNIDDLKRIFYSGNIKESEEFYYKESPKNNLVNFNLLFDYYFNIINNQAENTEDLLNLMNELRNIVDRVCPNENLDKRNMLIKVSLYIESLEVLMENKNVEKFSKADMGESGIMYKATSKEGEYLIKPGVDKHEFHLESFRAEVQKAASKLQERISPDTCVHVETKDIKIDDEIVKVAVQEKVNCNDNSNYLEKWVKNPIQYPLSETQINQLLQEYVVDFLLCNFDCYAGNFVLDSNNNIRGIDKEQSFKFLYEESSLNPDFKYTPNGQARIPIYSYLFDRFKNGQIDIDLNHLRDIIDRVSDISDEEYADIFREYASSVTHKGLDYEAQGIKTPLVNIMERRYKCIEKLNEYVQELSAYKNEGIRK